MKSRKTKTKDNHQSSGIAAASALLEEGVAVVNIDQHLSSLTARIFNEGTPFFELDGDSKQKFAMSSSLEGYRPLGQEYSQIPERPDLSESFSWWYKNRNRNFIDGRFSNLGLHIVGSKMFEPYMMLAEQVMEEIRIVINGEANKVNVREMSYLQLNYYQPTLHSRDFLQDSHEDGHLLTFVTSHQKGLEVEAANGFRPFFVDESKLLVMAGSLITILTGGRIPPTVHRVRRHEDLSERQSLMFFINPSIEAPIEPWVVNTSNRGIDLRDVAIANSAAFGLPSLRDI
jgi:isopenicillin N synthase-like dioxygenase